MKIGIIVAMQSELECVRCLLENPREEQHGSSLFIIGTNGKHELILTQIGIGKVLVRRRLCMGADRRTSRPVPQRPGIGGKGFESIDRLVSL